MNFESVRNVDGEEELVKHRVGLLHKPMNFSIANELMHIDSAHRTNKIDKLSAESARHTFT